MMSFEMMTQQCFLKAFKTEEKTCLLNIQMNNHLLCLDTSEDVMELRFAKTSVS